MSDEPRNVVEALIRVVRDLPAVGKDQKMAGESGGYAYRGIEAMTAAAQPLFGLHGVIPCPRVLESTVTAITKGGKPWVHRELRIDYVLRGPNGPEDYIIVGPFVAEADDNSDKSANKAMSQAYKQMLLQVLVISDRKDDPDDSNVSRDAPSEPETVGNDLAAPTYRKALSDGYSAEELDMVAADAVGRPVLLPAVLRSEWAAVREAWTAYKTEHPKSHPPAAGSTLPGDGSSAPADSEASNGGSVTPQDLPPEGVELGGKARKYLQETAATRRRDQP